MILVSPYELAISKLERAQEQSRIPYYLARDRQVTVTKTADRLAEAMKDRGIDQSRLAREIGVTQGTISLILLGKTQRSKHLPAIATYLGVSLSWLLGFDDEKYPSPEQVLLGPRERQLVELFREIGPVEQLMIQQICGSLAFVRKYQDLEFNLVSAEAPGRPALARMFEGLLRSIGPSAPLAEQAQLLAERLPIGLSQLRGPLFDDPVADEEVAPADLATSDPEPR